MPASSSALDLDGRIPRVNSFPPPSREILQNRAVQDRLEFLEGTRLLCATSQRELNHMLQLLEYLIRQIRSLNLRHVSVVLHLVKI